MAFGYLGIMEDRVRIIWTGNGMRKMITYKALYKNYKHRKGELMGILIERRKNLRGESLFESGLKWAKSMFGQEVKDEHAIIVVPHELKSKKNCYGSPRKDDIQEDS